jgi:hypothetical protein
MTKISSLHLEINDDNSTRLQPKLNGRDHSKLTTKKGE